VGVPLEWHPFPAKRTKAVRTFAPRVVDLDVR